MLHPSIQFIPNVCLIYGYPSVLTQPKDTKHKLRKLGDKSSKMLLQLNLASLLLSITLIRCEKVVVDYFGEDYLVTGGCPATDLTVLRWHKFCTFLHGDSTLCVTERFGKNLLTVPRFSNVCDALCHTTFTETMSTCPKEKGGQGKLFSPKGLR